ncbi:MAG: proteasome accessory factor PafA2 family protein [Candidatus Aenigmatarchaeota archaeon]
MHRKRIYGLETEYAIYYVTPISSPSIKRALFSEYLIKALFETLCPGETIYNLFLENGGRLYQDTGCHPEYATPECSNIRDAVLYDIAGERILNNISRKVQQSFEEEGLLGKFKIFKNNTDSIGNTYGCHENYLIRQDVNFSYLTEKIIPFLVTRTVFTGSGKYYISGNNIGFKISQRADFIEKVYSGSTTGDRPIINTREEPLSDPTLYKRLHIIAGDSNISPFTTYLKLGTMAIVLDMVESGFFKREMEIKNPLKALHDINEDITCQVKIEMKDGKYYTPLEIQEIYLEHAEKYCNNNNIDNEFKVILENWKGVVQTLKTDPLKLADRIDWVIKLNLVENYMKKNSRSDIGIRIQQLDIAYHDIDTDTGIFHRLENAGLVIRLFKEEEIECATCNPPHDTRAHARGEIVKYLKKKGLVSAVDWSSINLEKIGAGKIIMNDPFDSTLDKFYKIKSKIQDLDSTITNPMPFY